MYKAPDVNNDGALDAREKALGLFELLLTATAWVATPPATNPTPPRTLNPPTARPPPDQG